MPVPLPLVTSSAVACPDCPAIRRHAFGSIIKGPASSTCAFHCATIEAREALPDRWFGAYGIALVRRGVVIRQRTDAQGRATAVDAAGPGCMVSLAEPSEPISAAGYAATRLLVCLCPADVADREVRAGHDGVATDLVRAQREALDRLERIADARGRATIESKVGALLTALADTLSPPKRRSRIPSGLQQRDMAVLLGIRHESVCRVLTNLEKRRVVRRETDGIHLLDRAALEAT